jgi:hypothetical protein
MVASVASSDTEKVEEPKDEITRPKIAVTIPTKINEEEGDTISDLVETAKGVASPLLKQLTRTVDDFRSPLIKLESAFTTMGNQDSTNELDSKGGAGRRLSLLDETGLPSSMFKNNSIIGNALGSKVFADK